MEITFVAVALVVFFALYVPGYVFFRALRIAPLVSFLIAPLYSLACCAICCQAYSVAGIEANGALVLLPACFVSLVFYGLQKLRSSKKHLSNRENTTLGIAFDQGDWKILFLEVVVAVALVSFIFLGALPRLDSFTQAYDNYSHLSAIRSCLETGNYTLFSASIYPLANSVSSSPWGAMSGAYYPALFYVFTAAVVSLSGCSLALGLNAVILIVSAVVFPCSMFLLVRIIFKERKYFVASSICVMAFAAYPWGLIDFGPLYPNLLAFALLPLFLALAMVLFSRGLNKTQRVGTFFLCALALLCMVLAHPNALFSAYLLLIPFLVKVVYQGLEKYRLFWRLVGVVLTLVLCFCLWCFLYKLPALQSVIAFYWEALGSKSEVLARVLSLSLTTLSAPQWALAFCVLLGVVVSFFKREFLWLTFTYGLVALVFVLGCSSNGFLKHFLIGFWYTDPFRVAVMLSIAATPLAAIGMVGIYGLIEKLSRVVQPNRQTGCTVAMSALLVVMFFFANYCPSFAFGGSAEVKSSFGIFQDRIHSLTDAIYDEDEQDFVQQAKTFINDGDIVINDPYDGSAYLYGIEGVDVFYRRFHGYDYASETEYSHLLRENLADYASNSEVQDAVNETGAKWVLLLDAKDGELIQDDNLDTRWENWDPPRGAIENWLGLYEIKEETPGFELVLSDGDMRLYKILG